MRFYSPRRHRRRLLFPPGLLALAGLLWLGCVAVGSWRERLSQRHVLQLTMPVRPVYNKPESPTIRDEVPVPQKVCKMCTWHVARFTGNTATDRREQLRISHDVRHIVSDSMHAGGIRVHFASTAHYSSLVFLLNLMLQSGVKKYWLDITRNPTTFYAFNKPPDPSVVLLPGCLLCGDVMPYTTPAPPPVPFWVRFDDWVTEFWGFAWFKSFLQAEWRFSAWLLVTITALSGWRAIRAWRPA